MNSSGENPSSEYRSGTPAGFPHAFSLSGETALITGGGSGLGLGIARCMIAAGAKAVLVGRRESMLRDACAQLGPNAIYEPYDVTDFDGAAPLIDRIQSRVGSVSILVNNAGLHLKRSAIETTPQEFNEVLQTNVLAAHNLTQIVLPGMLERKCGSILFIASMAALFGVPHVIAYSAAKSACVGMVRSLSTEVASHGIRVNAIAPGWIESPMLRKALSGDQQRAAKIIDRTPMARFGESADIGWAAVYLCSPAAKFVTGVVLPVDGGASIGF